jgi:hypothetical protein
LLKCAAKKALLKCTNFLAAAHNINIGFSNNMRLVIENLRLECFGCVFSCHNLFLTYNFSI